MRFKNSFKDEFGRTEGTAFFPYFNKEITVICKEELPSEYIERQLGYLEQVDEALMLQICKYAEFWLKDVLENTSAGEGPEGEEAFPYDSPLDLLQYFGIHTLYIENPPESIPGSDEMSVLNLSGYCDWWEDEGLQCLVRDGKVIYLGYFEDASVWADYSRIEVGNYVHYEALRERLEKAKKPVIAEDWKPSEAQLFHNKWSGHEAGSRLSSKMMKFIQYISQKENVSVGEAIIILEGLCLYQIMNDYPQFLEESFDFWCECYCVEKESDAGELMRYICENGEQDLF